MIYERALYHKLMLEIGLTESFDRELDELLEREDPLSNLVLDLSTCGGDRSKQIHVLTEYILSASPEEIDKDAVFSWVASDFLSYYEKKPDDLEDFLRKLHSVAYSSGFYEENPWDSMWELYYLYDEIELGWITEARLREKAVALLRDKIPIFESGQGGPQPRQNTLLARIKQLLKKKR